MNEKEVKELVLLNMANYENWNKNASDEMINAVMKSWLYALGEYQTDVVITAYNEAFKTSKFPVLPAHIIEVIKKAKASQDPDIEELWQQLLKAARKCAYQAQFFSCGNDSQIMDGKTLGEERKMLCDDILSQLPQVCQEFVGNRSRLIEYGEIEDEQFYFYRFRDFVRNRRERAEICQAMLKPFEMLMKLGEGDNNE